MELKDAAEHKKYGHRTNACLQKLEAVFCGAFYG